MLAVTLLTFLIIFGQGALTFPLVPGPMAHLLLFSL